MIQKAFFSEFDTDDSMFLCFILAANKSWKCPIVKKQNLEIDWIQVENQKFVLAPEQMFWY